jgi:vacuolar-type H+-ATPase subunit E/Vma4
MSREKLKDSLISKSDARALDIWQKAELQLEQYRQEVDDRSAEQLRETQSQQKRQLEQKLDQLANRSAKRARRIRLFAEERFANRLWQLAIGQLVDLTSKQKADCLRQLAAELPELDWESITVHPIDRQQAVELFPDCHIDTDPDLIGGVLAVTADGAVRIDNSLLKRLKQLWPKLSGEVLDTLKAEKRDA